MKAPIHLRILLCLTLVVALSPVLPAAAQTCNGLPCTITGTSGSDVLNGTSGADVICGLQGSDTMYGGGGNDTICGDAGADLLVGDPGSDWLNGGSGSDTALWYTAVNANLSTGTAMDGTSTDTLIGIENLIGSDYADTLIGDSLNNSLDGQGGNDTLIGNDGNDSLIGRHGDDLLNGGNGADTLNGVGETDTAKYDTAITASLTTGSASDGDTLIGIENLFGSSGNDILEGNGGNNVLYGDSGIDYLDGQGGTDSCDGGLPPGRPLFEEPDPDTCIRCETTTRCTVI